VPGRVEGFRPVDEARHVRHAQALEGGGQVPGVDQPSVDCGLAADRVAPRAV
jgi:hypothetical protein